MNEKQRTRISKRMSLVLRHQPGSIGITLDDAGWVEIDTLLGGFAKHGLRIEREVVEEVVETNPKKRFEIDGDRVRARQGHSIDVELGYEPQLPPDVLYHGTAESNVESIRENGLHRAKRHAVHLSTDPATMLAVGSRHGKPVVVAIDAARMHADGFQFTLTGNNVWLTDSVPAEYVLENVTT